LKIRNILKYRRIFAYFLIAIFVVWLIFYLLKHKSDFQFLLTVNWQYIVVIALLIIIFLYMSGRFLQTMLVRFNIRLKLFEYFGLAVVTTMGNYLIPFQGGMGMRAFYLRKKHGFSYSEFAGTSGANYVIVFFIYSLILVLFLTILYLKNNIINLPLIIFGTIVLSVCSTVIIFAPKLKTSKNRWWQKAVIMINCWHKIRKNKRLIFDLTVLAFMNLFINALTFYYSFKAFGLNISLFKAIFMSNLAGLSLLINLTPGAIGIREAVVVFSGQIISIPSAESLSVALLNRSVALLVVFILGPIFSYILRKELKNETKK